MMGVKRGDRVLPTLAIAAETVLAVPGTVTATRMTEDGIEAHVRWDDGDQDWYEARMLRPYEEG